MKKTKSVHPEWALKHRQKGTELRLINGTYYLYQVTSKWNPDKKRSQKITGKLLGKITSEGFHESDKDKLRKNFDKVLETPPQVKEYGASYFIKHNFSQYLNRVKNHFPEIWQEIIGLAYVRLLYQAPIKNIGVYFEQSYLSEFFPDVTLGEKRAGALLRKIGSYREKVVGFMHQFIGEKENILIDATHLISHSNNIDIAKHGYNSQMEFDPQINLMLIFSAKQQMPVFYRILPGNIREVVSFRLTLQEAGIKDATIIADKGFYSNINIESLDQEKLTYIIPLKRDSSLIDYSKIAIASKKGFDGYFKYHDRFIWFYTIKHEKKNVTVFYDDILRTKEEHDYLYRIEIHPESYTIETFREKQPWFGTLSIFYNIPDKNAEDIYNLYKIRGNIETMIDAMKNTLEADKAYMQNEMAFQGWMFINFIALQWYYQIYLLLKEKDLLKNYSPKDLLMHLSGIKRLKINQTWHIAEFTKKTQTLLDKIQLPIT